MSEIPQSNETKHPRVEVVTNKGSFVLELFPEDAPGHVANMLKLAGEGFYNGLHIHRVVADFVVQAGCPFTRESATHPRAGTGDAGYKLPAEFNKRPHLRGTLAMARAQHPDSAGSQWYVCLAPAPFLDGNYTVFGEVEGDGMEVVDQLAVGDELEVVRVLDQ